MPKTSTISTMIARTVAYTVALVMLGWVSTAIGASNGSSRVEMDRASETSIQTANLLVPKRTRLVIKFERTAVC
jgi:hypothetical protein